ncbi:MAG: glutamate-5-semialdehyde dehydrogenase [Verrucomicrobia bacterium]|nr:glutamate-5-semialdehyde dehydrogenase [Verrucomicrobiota bacterium]
MATQIFRDLEQVGLRARQASRALAQASTQQKHDGLHAMAEALTAHTEDILTGNGEDVQASHRAGLPAATIDRLRLDPKRLAAMASSVREVAALPDPVGQTLRAWSRPNGLRIAKVCVPIGVIGFIYESRPNVTSDAAALCLKTGNVVILRGGSEAIHSNLAISRALREGCERVKLPADGIQLVATTDRSAVQAMAELDRYIDLIIPRGGHSLIETVTSLARMPVIKHYDGICHVYVDCSADLAMATDVIVNAKAQRPGVCNAAETLLVHESIAQTFLPRCADALRAKKVELRGDQRARQILGEGVKPATEDDWRTEYLDLILSVRVVPDLEAAIDHIEQFGSHHTDAIVAEDAGAAETFLREVDSSVVLWNASTRFNDGGEFGFGAEVGISTNRVHARGPMGLEELTIYKYVVRGSGQLRS